MQASAQAFLTAASTSPAVPTAMLKRFNDRTTSTLSWLTRYEADFCARVAA
jgi:hypothetical protein